MTMKEFVRAFTVNRTPKGVSSKIKVYVYPDGHGYLIDSETGKEQPFSNGDGPAVLGLLVARLQREAQKDAKRVVEPIA